jgi:hypothetical protein
MSGKNFNFLRRQTVDIVSLKFIVLALMVSFSGCLGFLYWSYQNQVSKLTDTVVVIDPVTGHASVGERTYAYDPEIRKWEYEDQVHTLYQNLFTFDVNNFDTNLQRALSLMDTESADFIYSEYNEGGVERRVKQYNWEFTVYVDSVLIDNSVRPNIGVCYARQTIRRRGGESLTRNVHSRFAFKDISKSRRNVHGVMITDFEIFNKLKLSE